MTVEFAVQNVTSGEVDEFHTSDIIDVCNQLERDRLTLVMLRAKPDTPRLRRLIQDETGTTYRVVCREVGEWEELK